MAVRRQRGARGSERARRPSRREAQQRAPRAKSSSELLARGAAASGCRGEQQHSVKPKALGLGRRERDGGRSQWVRAGRSSCRSGATRARAPHLLHPWLPPSLPTHRPPPAPSARARATRLRHREHQGVGVAQAGGQPVHAVQGPHQHHLVRAKLHLRVPEGARGQGRAGQGGRRGGGSARARGAAAASEPSAGGRARRQARAWTGRAPGQARRRACDWLASLQLSRMARSSGVTLDSSSGWGPCGGRAQRAGGLGGGVRGCAEPRGARPRPAGLRPPAERRLDLGCQAPPARPRPAPLAERARLEEGALPLQRVDLGGEVAAQGVHQGGGHAQDAAVGAVVDLLARVGGRGAAAIAGGGEHAPAHASRPSAHSAHSLHGLHGLHGDPKQAGLEGARAFRWQISGIWTSWPWPAAAAPGPSAPPPPPPPPAAARRAAMAWRCSWRSS